MKNPYCKEALNPPKTDVRKSVTFFEYDALLKESVEKIRLQAHSLQSYFISGELVRSRI